ncbi:hypothetical protein [Chloroflexus sp.]|uniref:hypothetical protein n=1 Tax=Chloroflexus sp. TaxID=1904827 RepID=UPI002ACDA4CF|nr:hypothetical protein [Chloroflexus sp.]
MSLESYERWSALFQSLFTEISPAIVAELVGEIPEDTKVYSSKAKPRDASSDTAGTGTESPKRIAVRLLLDEEEGRKMYVWVCDYIISHPSACGIVHAGSGNVDFIPWDKIVSVQIFRYI